MPDIPPLQPTPVIPAPSEQTPVFYALTEEAVPPTEPWYRKRQFVTLVVAALVAMGVLTLVLVFAVNVFQRSQGRKALEEDKKELMEEMVENGTSQSDAARQAAFVEGCSGLSGDAYANCVSLIAFDQGDPTLCDSLEGDQERTCKDGAQLVAAKAEGDLALCAEIADEILRASCETTIQGEAVLARDCAAYGVPEDACDGQELLDAALETGDPASCDGLADDLRITCLDLFSSLDQDGDGLTLREEFTYGTSDEHADTDGDGYTDEEEVRTGHDPLSA